MMPGTMPFTVVGATATLTNSVPPGVPRAEMPPLGVAFSLLLSQVAPPALVRLAGPVMVPLKVRLETLLLLWTPTPLLAVTLMPRLALMIWLALPTELLSPPASVPPERVMLVG